MEEQILQELSFDGNGNLVPYKLISLSISELEFNLVLAFPSSSTR
jgi:hypothetical protein